MKIQVNLATRPYVELRPFFLRLRIVMASLVVVAIAALIGSHLLQTRLNRAQAQMDDLQAKTRAQQQEKQNNERRMRQPENAAVLERAHFLNGLFLRKSFSWTAVMMDLETVLPTGVQVTSIEPQISTEGDVIIRLRVAGDRDRAVLLVRNLERSRRFLEARLTGESTQAKQGAQNGQPAANGAPAGVEFEILAKYNPLPVGESFAKPVGAKPVVAKPVGAKAVGAKASGTVPGATTPRPARDYNPQRDGIVLRPYSDTHPRKTGGTR